MSSSDAPCDLLPWDSAFFGCSIARVRADVLSPDACRHIDAWCAQQRVACLYFQARADDRITQRLAEQNGFSLVDVRLTFERNVMASEGKVDGGWDVRLARRDDVPTLEAIAASSHHDTRFYFDGRFARDKCDQMYAQWILRSCAHPTGTVWVAEAEGRPAGYVTCARDLVDGQAGRIGLIAVADVARGRGLGTRLLHQAIDWIAGTGAMRRAIVATQGRNVAAQRLYQRCGFVTRDLQLYYHKWYA
jgi:GNAT superfamily N-acetyltransferase